MIHCCLTFQVIVEAIPYEVEEYVVPGDGYIKQDQLHDTEELKPQNQYSASEKLGMALEMAESLADLHGFSDGVMYVVHAFLFRRYGLDVLWLCGSSCFSTLIFTVVYLILLSSTSLCAWMARQNAVFMTTCSCVNGYESVMVNWSLVTSTELRL